MATRPKTRSGAEAGKPSRLGNDPFQRGAAPSAPAPVPLAEQKPAQVQTFAAPDDARPMTRPETPAAKSQKREARPKSKAAPKLEARPKSKAAPKVEPRPKSKAAPKVEARPKSKAVPAAEARPATRPARPSARPRTQPVPVAPPPEPTPVEEEREPAALVRHVHVPEVEPEAAPHAEAPPRASPKATLPGVLTQLLAGRQAQQLLVKLLMSPRAMEVGAAAISGTTAVRALLARPEGPRTVDDFGEDPALVARTAPTVDFLYRHYFRVSVEGAEHLPRRGPVLAIANHAGALPLDGPIVRSALERARENSRARWLVEDALFNAPFLGTWLNRLGAVRACPENATRLLEGGAALAVFPEGVNALTKTFRRRYQLQRFGRGGFVKLALRTGAPLVPTAVLGAEESMPILATLSAPGLGLPLLPVTPSLLPLPTKWTIAFLPPVDLTRYGPDDANDLGLVQRITEDVRTAIHEKLEALRAERSSVFRG